MQQLHDPNEGLEYCSKHTPNKSCKGFSESVHLCATEFMYRPTFSVCDLQVLVDSEMVGGDSLPNVIIRSNQREKQRAMKCESRVFADAWTTKISRACTGFDCEMVYGLLAANASDFANRRPQVASKPKRVEAKPTKLMVIPELRLFNTSALGGVCSGSCTPCRSLAASRV